MSFAFPGSSALCEEQLRFIHGFPNFPKMVKYKLLRDFLFIENRLKDDFLV